MADCCTLFWPLLATLFLSSLPPCAHCYQIANAESGSVEAGEIVHYTLTFTEPVVVVLLSDEGDVDLYASPTYLNSKPSSDDHEISSVSCGMDMLALIMSPDLRKYSLGIHGHVRYDKSRYSLYVIKPSPEDIRSYQVWDVDPETNRDVLLIDADPMFVLNDIKLTEMIERLEQNRGLSGAGSGAGSGKTKINDIIQFIGVVLIKIIEILVEILL